MISATVSITLTRGGFSAVLRICRTVLSLSCWRRNMRSGIWRVCYGSCDSFFVISWDPVPPHFNARAPGALGAFLVPQAPQQGHPPPTREDQNISVGPVRYRLRLEAALGHAVCAVYLLRPRACPQRCPDTLQVTQHVVERGGLYPSRCRRMSPRLPRASGLACRTCPAAPPTSPAASQPWLPARVPPFPCSQPATRRALRCVPPLFLLWAEAAARGAWRGR